jgi:hypothetical protein
LAASGIAAVTAVTTIAGYSAVAVGPAHGGGAPATSGTAAATVATLTARLSGCVAGAIAAITRVAALSSGTRSGARTENSTAAAAGPTCAAGTTVAGLIERDRFLAVGSAAAASSLAADAAVAVAAADAARRAAGATVTARTASAAGLAGLEARCVEPVAGRPADSGLAAVATGPAHRGGTPGAAIPATAPVTSAAISGDRASVPSVTRGTTLPTSTRRAARTESGAAGAAGAAVPAGTAVAFYGNIRHEA